MPRSPDEDRRAARTEGLSAYWIGNSCLSKEKEIEENVWRISDVICGAQVVAVIVSPTVMSSVSMTKNKVLRDWDDRRWTFPEVLLGPKGKSINAYTTEDPEILVQQWCRLRKDRFLKLVWGDVPVARQRLITMREI
ncbi:hypothetical protein K469DRAFT_693163 [Zopfia rhizophila CBS 207.26]|uniref:Uncharacterized protein n=1 Tax=Zopfia rhizophila CBS 207.26 TaxID=1314779 RepID=A0A6A6ELQ9_9PEZI|nr:hypothetical protein K469DRAFT_693163 [Zopfia rhizophila CBS 207.26]